MAQAISISIDLSKLDKTRIVAGKNNSKYYNMMVYVNDEKDDYGNDCQVTDSQTKEEREAKEKKTYLGRGRVVWQSHYEQKPAKQDTSRTANASQPSDDLPF